MKISIITPAFNSSDTLSRAIESVLAQDYQDFEHIVVDGGSTDGTVELLQTYDHITWISEPDHGQVDAMHKGFAMSAGQIIGNLNADDHYLPRAFSTVIPEFDAGAHFVVGKVEVRSEHNQTTWINDPEIELSRMLKHWLPDAFCVNPAGYFYRREVQEAVPFNPDNQDKHDLEFLLEAVMRFPFRKIDALLGVFEHVIAAKTFQQQMRPSYWTVANFPFVERILSSMDHRYQRSFRVERDRGYQVRRHWTVSDALRLGAAAQLAADHELLFLPADESRVRSTRCGFVDFDWVATPGDWVVAILTAGDVAGDSIFEALAELPTHVLATRPYHIEAIGAITTRQALPAGLPSRVQPAIGLALHRVFAEHQRDLRWKFIAGVRDPIESALSSLCAIHRRAVPDLMEQIDQIAHQIITHFDRQYREVLGVDVYATPFDRAKGYSIVEENGVQVLVYRFEALPDIFSEAMESFLGIPGMIVPPTTAHEASSGQHRRLKGTLQIDQPYLEKIYSSRYVRHFFSDDEIRHFCSEWRRERSGSARAGSVPEPPDDLGLIYDVGAHDGQDTAFYLKKGFRVVAIDANPFHTQALSNRFAADIESGRLQILNVGIVAEPTGSLVEFFVNERLSHWSSFVMAIAGRDGGPLTRVAVPVRTLSDIIEEYGDPYYVKIDIEGYDHIALRSLFASGRRPQYVSVENGHMGMLTAMVTAGYDQYKYVQQNDVQNQTLPAPAREGLLVFHQFEPGASGPFGDEAPGEWLSAEEVRACIARIWDPDGFAKNPAHDDAVHGWFDLHAKYPTS